MKIPKAPCHGCEPPKRFPGCHNEEICTEWGKYVEEKTAHDAVVLKGKQADRDYAQVCIQRNGYGSSRYHETVRKSKKEK